MASQRTDVVVLGAGMVGVGAALHIQAKGRAVALIDRTGAAARETSFGNAGIVQSEAAYPYAFPRALGEIVPAALNLDPRVHIRYLALPWIALWVWRYFLASSPARRLETALAMRGLVDRCVAEHQALAEAAGAQPLLRGGGWISVFRTSRGEDLALAEAAETKPFGVPSVTLSREQTLALEPHLGEAAKGGVHYTDPLSTSDPEGLASAYARLFVERGGAFLVGDARTLAQSGGGWTAQTANGLVQADAAVVALGPWSGDLAAGFGYAFPLGVKRGYHMHYATRPGAFVSRPMLDLERGYLLAPMTRGLRLTTGAEFARRDDPPSPAHLHRLEPSARELFPLAERLDPEPWLGKRPCLPDMKPVIGPAPRHKGLWFDFGHQHLGLTLGPVSGRLIAELMAGETPFVDPTPFRADRF